MRNSHTPVVAAIAVVAIATTIRAVRWLRLWVDETLAHIDQALCLLGDHPDDGEDEEDPEQAQTERLRTVGRVATLTSGELENGEYGVLPVNIRFIYDEKDPLAVVMVVAVRVETNGRYVGTDRQAWGFARDILDTALSRGDDKVIGEGDISVQYNPARDQVWVWLTNLNGFKHRLSMPAERVREFMVATYRMVPAVQEGVYVEDAIDSLLNGAGE